MSAPSLQGKEWSVQSRPRLRSSKQSRTGWGRGRVVRQLQPLQKRARHRRSITTHTPSFAKSVSLADRQPLENISRLGGPTPSRARGRHSLVSCNLAPVRPEIAGLYAERDRLSLFPAGPVRKHGN